MLHLIFYINQLIRSILTFFVFLLSTFIRLLIILYLTNQYCYVTYNIKECALNVVLSLTLSIALTLLSHNAMMNFEVTTKQILLLLITRNAKVLRITHYLFTQNKFNDNLKFRMSGKSWINYEISQ